MGDQVKLPGLEPVVLPRAMREPPKLGSRAAPGDCVGALCASRIPGTQREAVRSAAIMAARAELLPGLARVPGLVDSLRAAEGSRDAAAAAGAAEVLGALRPHL